MRRRYCLFDTFVFRPLLSRYRLHSERQTARIPSIENKVLDLDQRSFPSTRCLSQHSGLVLWHVDQCVSVAYRNPYLLLGLCIDDRVYLVVVRCVITANEHTYDQDHAVFHDGFGCFYRC